jgi:23S rRNA (guanine745-N1)-methyltransferase
MHLDVVAALECPLCQEPLVASPGALRCATGHAFDVARSGYVSFLVGRSPNVGDSPAMVAARAELLDAGHFDPLSGALAAAAIAAAAPGGIAVEVGAGTARHLARVLDALPGRAGLAIDASAAAARRAARAHPRASAIAADARARLPLRSGVVGVALVAFAPRNGSELRRIHAGAGALVVATPLPHHLAELRAAFDLVRVDPLKERRLEAALSPSFARASSENVSWEMALAPGECAALVRMGPSAHHLGEAEIDGRAAALPPRVGVTGACRVETWLPLPP